jgi:2-keto-4-pentenoate hydratase/2-oxohepta-3-ene-1,7-dioic acid hydratase in catechol pathway
MIPYQHVFSDGREFVHALGKIVCVGRNYAAHAAELNNPVPQEPLLFIKPATAAVAMTNGITLPLGMGECHHELEVALLIGREVKAELSTTVATAIVGVGLALDLTLRDLQQKLKENGHPWEKAKAFDGACPLTEFIPAGNVPDLGDLSLAMQVNGSVRQSDRTASMITSIPALLSYISGYFTLVPGDVVLTGTPAGVGRLESGDHLQLQLGNLLSVETRVNPF